MLIYWVLIIPYFKKVESIDLWLVIGPTKLIGTNVASLGE
jgi:hypothetical protein